MEYLTKGISPDSAIKNRCQIRIECPAPQPRDRVKYPKPAAAKDLVIWRKPLETTWDENWNPANIPKAIIEWKTKRSGNPNDDFDLHDQEWMKAYTLDYKDSFGFLVSTHATEKHRTCRWAKVRSGVVRTVHTVSKSI